MSETAGYGDKSIAKAWEAKIHIRVHDATKEIASDITAANGMAEYIGSLTSHLASDQLATTEIMERTLDAAYVSSSANRQLGWEKEMIRMGLLSGYVCGQRMLMGSEQVDVDQHITDNFRQFRYRTAGSPEILKAELFSTGHQRYEEQVLYIDSSFVSHAGFAQVIKFDGSHEAFWDSFGYTLGMTCTYLRILGVRERARQLQAEITDEDQRLLETNKFFAMHEAAAALGKLVELQCVSRAWNTLLPSLQLMAEKLGKLGFTEVNGEIIVAGMEVSENV